MVSWRGTVILRVRIFRHYSIAVGPVGLRGCGANLVTVVRCIYL